MKKFVMAITLMMSIFLIPLVLSQDDLTVTPITKGAQIVNFGEGIKISLILMLMEPIILNQARTPCQRMP